MDTKVTDAEDEVRDGIESLPEMMDIGAELRPVPLRAPKVDDVPIDDTDLDEALMETFPASDPLASGRFD